MIEFSKAHACGNDFLIVDTAQVGDHDRAALALALCARTTGIGADGVEYLTPLSKREGKIRLYNADGSGAEISGNGTRCVAAWMAHRGGLQIGEAVRLETDAGTRVCTLETIDGPQFGFTTTMGVPQVHKGRVNLEEGISIDGAVVSTGNPHFVVVVEDASFNVAGLSWQQAGAAICAHADFPAQTNVEFARVVASDRVEIRIFERGVGPTSSSGTGTSASAAAMIALHGMPSRLRVQAPGGEQVVVWPSASDELQLTGPAVVLASGNWLGSGEL